MTDPSPDSRSTASGGPPLGDAPRRRARAELQGIVQGVGFRPYVYQLATSLGLRGFVRNDTRGVLVEVEGDPDRVGSFLERLPEEIPPLADVDRFEKTELEPEGAADFRIVISEGGGAASALVTPDTATCSDCLRELFDPADRRFRYPFINCTNCGPRFTIVRGVPYDRSRTTMASFTMCGPCREEYEDPTDRRFHAQPNACPVCGPSCRLVNGEGEELELGASSDAVAAAAARLREGEILAMKGLGGFHLACLAHDEQTVSELRRRKHRYEKPFALMVPDVDRARRLARLTEEEAALMASPQAPIALLRRREGGEEVARSVAPGLQELGLMLPYSPVHHLLLSDVDRPLVMTSGNLSDEPIAYRDEEALRRLDGIADCFLVNDRPIETRTDDSVARVLFFPGGWEPTTIRRSRGFVPVPVNLPSASPRPLLACGAHLKNTFCVVKGERAWVSHHIGDLENFETLRSFEEGIAHFRELFDVTPELAVHDLHPSYLSTRYALEECGLETMGVQHHHAHLAACLAEHGRDGPAIGVVYDGTGYGADGTVWGGEVLLGGCADFERIAHLWPCRLPGGEAAIREPWRMARVWLDESGVEAESVPARLRDDVDPERWELVGALARKEVASPLTSSMGRLFDAVAALCGLRARVTYEGQAAIELEAAAEDPEAGAYPLPMIPGEPAMLDARPLITAVVEDLETGATVPRVASRFHHAVAEGTFRACRVVAEERGVETVVLSGGVFQNRLLAELLAGLLHAGGFEVLFPRRFPVNDGGVSVGQAAVATARLVGAG